MPLEDLIVGHWGRAQTEPCAESYPDELEFRTEGIYLGRAGPGQGFVHWGGGDYEVVATDRIKLQDQTDMMVEYRLAADADRLRFTAPDGCEIAYRRSTGAGMP